MHKEYDWEALSSSAYEKAFSVALAVDEQTVNQCLAVIDRSICTGASLRTTALQLQSVVSEGCPRQQEGS
ncbi:hypothetical protein FYP89_26145 [Salmonella enterica]|nr:hypothetical protein [Salmonella enterica]EDW3217120.1 hypothetical protein [Salmonella enterica]EJD2478503.1 hypothetical protein [Salmonella enterica]EJU5707240.1 hypothetical protein [Salmonella enterica]EKE1977960.1 hypothetical protein [Salmonella enterica]